LNENLCRAFLQAGLTEEDVAARLQVDPKTVRRWVEGRMPYLRHRWALAAMVGLTETDLWPKLRGAPSRPDEVMAIYPHLDSVPEHVWLALFSAAEGEIGILADTAAPITGYPRVLAVLTDKAGLGVRVRICLLHRAPAVIAQLRGKDSTEIRLHRTVLYAAVYFSDDQLLVSQQVYGLPAAEAPVLHLRRTGADDMTSTYLASFTEVWSTAEPSD
jgi:transcriptional regulator with XRE-family HTH domain